MHLIDTDSAIDNKFVEGTPQIGQAATQLDPAWCNTIQAEIAAVVESVGIELDKADDAQLLQAINAKLSALSGTLNDAMTALTNNVNTSLAGMAPHILQILDAKWVASTEFNPIYYAVPDNTLKNRADYPTAWAKIQTSGMLAADEAEKLAKPWLYGPGDGVTTFQMPEWRSQFTRISSDGVPGLLGPSIGGFKANQNKAHTHGITTNMHDGTGDGNIADSDGTETPHTSATQSSGGDETVPDHIGMRFVIRMK